MKIFYSFLIIALAAILFLLPVPDGIRDFVSDLSTDTFESTVTAVGVTNATVTLTDPIYDDNRNFATVTSSNTTDVPVISAYNSTSQNLTVIGLVEDATRTLTVEYSVFNIYGGDAVEEFTSLMPFIWIIICFAFPIVALVAVVIF